MKRRDPTIVIALMIALGAHLAVLTFGVHAARRELGWWLQSPPAQAKAAPSPPIAPPQPPVDQLGDHDTNGTSINASPGSEPLQSAVAYAEQEQAAMQRDPAGFGGKGSNQQLDQTLRGDNGDNRPRSNATAQTAASVFGSRENAESQTSPKSPQAVPVKMKTTGDQPTVDPLSEGPMTPHPPESTSSPNSSDAQQQQEQQQQNGQKASQQGVGGKPGSAEPGAGDPIPTSDFESYPVTHVASRFVSGKVEPRPGRKMRMREMPHLGLAAWADLENMDRPYLVLLLKIDATGNVIDVKIEHSTGSENVDLPCQHAAYTWWFEPQKDPDTGKPHGELMEFTIYFG
jgi:hypothetical protein